MKKFWLVVLTVIMALCAVGLVACNGENGANGCSSSEHTHRLTYYSAVEATCTDDGNIEYWSCVGCGKSFSDENATNEIVDVVTVGKHEVVYQEQTNADCSANGNIAHYHCTNCGKNFSDNSGKDEITNVTLLAKHDLKYNPKVDYTCTTDGNIAYYTCLKCGKFFIDEDGKNQVTDTVIAKAHTGGTEIKNAVAPTINNSGYSGDTYCLGCGEFVQEGEFLDKLDHNHAMQKTNEIEETCTISGNIEYYTCSVCGKIYKDIDGIWEITIEQTIIVASCNLTYNERVGATCTENGNVAHYHCVRCNKNYLDDKAETQLLDIVILARHDLIFNTKINETCTENGTVAHYHCTVCNNNYEDSTGTNIIINITIIAGCDIIFNAKVDATCTENGTIEHWSCTKCGAKFSDEAGKNEILIIDIPASHTPGELQTVTQPTCVSFGWKKQFCQECGKLLKQEAISTIGHNFVQTSKSEETCTTDGYVIYTCNNSDCGQTKKEILYAHGHSFNLDDVCTECGFALSSHTHSYTGSTGVIVTAPTCMTMGYTTYTCSCGYSFRADYVEPLNHDWDSGTTLEQRTCTKDGKILYCCTTLGCDAEMEQIITASHEWSKNVIIEATCTTDGKMTKECSVCGEEAIEIISASHTWGTDTVITSPTCSEKGSSKHVCLICSASETFEVKELGHNFVDGTCQRCGATIPDVVVPSAGDDLYGMYFKIDDIISNYGPDYINEYGVMLDYNENANIERVAVYLTQDGTMWRRAIAVVGEGISYATYVPYLSYGDDIKYTGLNSSWINTFSLRENSDGIWCYSNYTTIGVNLEDMYGNLLLSLYNIGQAGAQTRIFDDLEEMIEWLKYGDIAPGHSHSMGSWIQEVAPTCSSKGMEKRECSTCEYYETNILSTVAHVYVSGKCKWCGQDQPTTPSTGDTYTRVDEDGTENANGEYILFGSYPQTDVTSTMSSVLSYGTLPTSTTLNGWTDYGYYVDGEVQSYMWYKDVVYDSETYRAVYFTSYRPRWNSSSSSADNSWQDQLYSTSNVYWFKFEPITWRILNENSGTALLLCESIIDSQAYQNCCVYNVFDYATDNSGNILTDGSGNKIYANNYAYSTIRAWLNDNFYNTAFSSAQQQIILTTTVDNSVSSTGYSTNSYACENTQDKVFLLSYSEVVNSSYGFNSSHTDYDTMRQKKNTDYAKVQGCYTYTSSSSYYDNGYWWLRSPTNFYSDRVRSVDYDGYVSSSNSVDNTYHGVVPALNLKLQ